MIYLKNIWKKIKTHKVLSILFLALFLLIGIIVFWGIKSRYFQYVHAKIVWNIYCKDEMIRLNPGNNNYINKGDGILNSIFCEWIYLLFKEKSTDALRQEPYDKDNKFEWSYGNVFLSVKGRKIKNLSPLGKLSMIDCLTITETSANNLDFVKTMRDLTYIMIYDTPIKDISGLRGKNMDTIALYGTCINDLSPLRDMHLNTFIIANNYFLKDISVFNSMTVKFISLENTGITSIESLRTCRGLRSLYLDNCKIKDLSPLEKKNILNLSIQNTLVEDLSPLLKTMNPQQMRLNITGCPAANNALPKGSLGGITL